MRADQVSFDVFNVEIGPNFRRLRNKPQDTRYTLNPYFSKMVLLKDPEAISANDCLLIPRGLRCQFGFSMLPLQVEQMILPSNMRAIPRSMAR